MIIRPSKRVLAELEREKNKNKVRPPEDKKTNDWAYIYYMSYGTTAQTTTAAYYTSNV